MVYKSSAEAIFGRKINGPGYGDPYGNRTRVSGVRGRRPRPLDEGATSGAEPRRNRGGDQGESRDPIEASAFRLKELRRRADFRAGCPSPGQELDRSSPPPFHAP